MRWREEKPSNNMGLSVSVSTKQIVLRKRKNKNKNKNKNKKQSKIKMETKFSRRSCVHYPYREKSCPTIGGNLTTL